MLPCFPSVWLRTGHKLAAGQYWAGGNGNGFTVVIPGDRDLPLRPEHLEFGWDAFGAPQLAASGNLLPAWARPVIASLLDGDGSMPSQLDASLLMWELRELGAVRPGVWWFDHEIPTSGTHAPRAGGGRRLEARPPACRPRLWRDSGGTGRMELCT
ncbi:MAG: hypothetical protein FJ029_15575 [Actinobacteria bacterium]|nr:hypothetical protein [Actinomycetota bacterium]